MTTFALGGANRIERIAAARPALRNWILAATVYFLAVFHRSSLGVAGLLAEQRFGITAGQLGVFVLLQIGVYAAMQIPTGILVDRYGPRRTLVAAAALMGVGQLVFAFAPSYPTALLARTMLGCGDAMTFVSVLRVVAARFSARRYPVLVALTSTIGSVGNVLATLPLTLLLERVGWTASFAVAASLSLVAAVAVWMLLDDATVLPMRLRTAHQVKRGLESVGTRVRAAWALPGTRVGFWVHFATMSTGTAFGLLWGQPYLVDGVGLRPAQASALLMLGVLTGALAGPVLGVVIGRRPALRVPVALVVSVVTVLGWAAVALLLGDHPAAAPVAALFVFTMIGGPASMIAFALARDYNSPRILGTASGVVNVGGFLATALIALVFGEAVTLLGGMSAHSLRLALVVPIVVQGFGALRAFVWFRRLRSEVVARQRRGEDVPVSIGRRHVWDEAWESPVLVENPS